MTHSSHLNAWRIEFRQVLGVFRSPWSQLALLAGVCVHILGFVMFKVTTEANFELETPEAFVRFPASGAAINTEVFDEQALLYDSEPIFLPTRWNAGPEKVYKILSVVGDSPFEPFSELRMIDVVNQDTYRWAVPEEKILSAPEDVLTLENPQLFAGFGRVTPPQIEIPDVDFSIAVYNLFDGVLVYEAYYSAIQGFPLKGGELWTVLELMVIVDTAGVTGEPLVAQSTGKPELDQFLKQFSRENLSRHLVEPGYFQIFIGP